MNQKEMPGKAQTFLTYSFTVIIIAVDIAAIVFRRYCDVNGLFFDHVMNNNCKT